MRALLRFACAVRQTSSRAEAGRDLAAATDDGRFSRSPSSGMSPPEGKRKAPHNRVTWPLTIAAHLRHLSAGQGHLRRTPPVGCYLPILSYRSPRLVWLPRRPTTLLP